MSEQNLVEGVADRYFFTDGEIPQEMTDAAAHVLFVVLEAGRSAETLKVLRAMNDAGALMFYSAVANQQKTNILGMAVTAKCVRYMFEAGRHPEDDEIDAD